MTLFCPEYQAFIGDGDQPDIQCAGFAETPVPGCNWYFREPLRPQSTKSVALTAATPVS
jgi:hypothetical protein